MSQQVAPSRDSVVPQPSRSTVAAVIKPEVNDDEAFDDADSGSGQWRAGSSKRSHDIVLASSSMADSKSMMQDDDDDDDAPSPRSKKARASRGGSDKHSKGLRQFSLKVCQKVESKGSTTYNEVCTSHLRRVLSTTSHDTSRERGAGRRRTCGGVCGPRKWLRVAIDASR